MRPENMNEAELQVWLSVYAAEFVRRRALSSATGDGRVLVLRGAVQAANDAVSWARELRT